MLLWTTQNLGGCAPGVAEIIGPREFDIEDELYYWPVRLRGKKHLCTDSWLQSCARPLWVQKGAAYLRENMEEPGAVRVITVLNAVAAGPGYAMLQVSWPGVNGSDPMHGVKHMVEVMALTRKSK